MKKLNLTNLMNRLNRRGSGANLNLIRYAAMVFVLLLGVGNAWAGGGSSNYYASLKITKSGPTGAGSVYVANSNSKPGSDNAGTAVQSAATTTSGGNVIMYWWVEINPGYNVTLSDKVTGGPYSAATANGSVSCKASTSANGVQAYTATATFVAVTVNSVDAASKDLAPTNPSIDYPFTVTFATSNLKTIALDLNKSPETADGKFTITSWAQDGNNVVATGKFNGGGSYGGASRNNSTTVSLQSKASGGAAKTCTVTANFPALAFVGVEATDVYATQGESGKTGSATFKYNYAAEDDFSDEPTLTPISGTGALTITGYTITPNFSDGTCEVTVDYTYDTNNGVGDTEATLTLTAANGDARSVTIAGHSEAMATNDASVTTTANVTTEYATFAEALAAANATSGATLTLLRNVDLGTITATNNINKAMTIDLNGKELRASVNATSVGILTVNKAVAVTIKDSKTGGKIINEIARNAEIRTITVGVAGATLTLESGTLVVHNTGQYASAANADLGVTAYASCQCRTIHQAAGTTVNITGGRVEAYGTRSVYGILQASSAATNNAGTTVLNVSGGEIYAEGPYSIMGIYAYGKVNFSGGTINAHVNTNMIDARYAADNANNLYNGYGYGIYANVSSNATASSCYYATVEMTGGTINVTNDRSYSVDRRNYGILFNAGSTVVASGKTGADGTLTQKASATGSIDGGEINVTSGTQYSFGVYVLGDYNSYNNTHHTVQIKNCKITSKAYVYAYGVAAWSGFNGTNNGCYAGDVELTNCDVYAESLNTSTAAAVWVTATGGTLFKDDSNATKSRCYGEYAVAGKAVINSGKYEAKTKTTSAFAVGTSSRYKTTYDSETTVAANRKRGGNAEAYPTLIIHGGTFKATSTTTTARGVSNGGYCTIDGGEFDAYATTNTAYGLYCLTGKITASGVKVSASATEKAYGALADCAVPGDKSTAPTGFAYAGELELNNCDITATTRTSTEARGVYVTATNKLYSWAKFHTDSTDGKWAAATTAEYYRQLCPCTIEGRDSVGIAIAAKATINGCDIKATAATTTAYGVYSTATSVPTSADSVASPVVNIKNTKFTVKTDGTTTAYGMYAGGPTTIDGCDFTVQPKTTTAYGVYAYDKKTTITNTKFDVKGTNTVYGLYANAAIGSTTGWDYHGEVELGEGNDMTVAATSGDAAHVLTLIATKRNIATGKFAGNYANAASAHVTGGTYKATATGAKSYVLNLSDQQVQGDVISRPACIIEDGKFWALASGGTTGICSANGQIGHIVLKGGFYNVNTNLAKYKEEGLNVNDVLAGTPEYTEGYRYKVTSELSGGTVCKVYQGNTLTQSYATLEEALQFVNANTGTNYTIVMVADYVLKKGDYILPSNATLVIPNDLSRKTAIGDTPTRENVNTPAPVQLVMLTFDNGVNMTVKGGIETSAVNTAANGGSAITGAPTGNFGRLHMVEGSTMTLESGANLNCWGYTTGKGEINALNGSTVREGFQLGYWRGGSATSSMLNNRSTWHAFPVTDYFIQNVEAPTTFRPGAQLLGYSGVNVSVVGIQAANNVKLVGTSASMFLMETADASEDTYVRKEYDPETDRSIWTVNSGAKIGSFSFSLAGNTVNSADYYLPISNNMTIYVNEGEFTVTQDVLQIPGSVINISKLGKLTVSSGKRLFVMDNEDWPGFVNHSTGAVSRWYYNALYSPSWTTNPRTLKYPPTTTRLPDAEIFVQGETEGSYYTSTSGANIHSTNDDAGKVKFVAAAGADNSIQHVVNTDNDRVTINFTTAQLKNETPETPYTSSKNTVAGEAFVYMEQQWVKVTDGCLTTRTDGSGTHEYAKPSDVVEVVSNGDNAYRDVATGTRYFINAVKPLTGENSDECVWWEVEPVTSGTYAGDYMANQEKYENYGAYYYWDGTAGYWKPRYVTVTWKNQDGTTLATYTNVMCNTSPKYLSASPTWANTSIEKHDWVGWRDADGNIYDKNAVLPVAQGNVTYTAYYNVSKYEYTIKFVNPDKTVIWAGLVEAGTIPECPVAPTQAPTASTVYTFTGWNTTPVEVTGTATYTAVYSPSTRKYHVTFYNYDAQTVLYEADVDYNTRPVYAGVTPFRANTSSFSYEWTGWQQGTNTYDTDDDLAIVTGNVNYIATYSQTDLKYQVFFKRQDGSVIDAPLFNYEETPAAFPANPTLASTVSTDYTFDHWDPAELVPVTEEGKVYTAYFSESPRQYTAHFVNYDGKTLNADQTIDYNTVPMYTGATPFKPNDSRNSFEFSGWAWEAGADWTAGSIAAGEAFPAIKGDITFTAQFTETLLQFNVRYVREDGTPLKEEKLKWGQSTTGFPSPVASYEDDTYSYTFDHWSPATVVNPVTTDATYTAYFNQAIKTYTITYDKGTNGTGSIDAGEKTHGVAFTLSNSKFTRTGYTQTGWSTTDGGAKAYELGGSYTANAAITLYPFWTVNTHTLTWNWDGGSTTSTAHTTGSVAYGTIIVYPEASTMTKENFVFNGWSIENATMPDENLTITAQWTPALVSVTAGGMTTYYTTLSGAFTAAKAKTNPTIKMLQDVALGASSVTYDGANTCTLDLNGHTISGTGTRLLIIDNASATFKVTDLGSKLGKLSLSTSSTSEAPFCVYVNNGNLQLEAGTIYTNSSAKNAGGVRTQTSGSSTFTMNGGTVHVEAGAGLTGYGVQTLGTAIINNGTVLVEASAIGYALWVQNTGATVTVENGKFNVTGANAYASNAIAPNAAMQLKGGYYSTKTMDNSATVDSKYVATNYHVFALTSGAEYDEGYRYKVAEAYTVTFNTNGHGTAPASQLIIKGQKATEPTAPTATGYTFGGWYKEAGCTNAWNFTSDVVTEAKTLYAKWTPVNYTITYNNLEGASNNNPANYNIESANIALANPGSRAGYDFAGWYTNEGLTTPAATPAITTGTTGNKVFYAKWTLKTYTITYNAGANGAGTVAPGVKTHDVNFTLSSSKFTREGYTQTGWSTSDGGGKAYELGGTYTANEAIELYPFWTINRHALTWNWNGGSTTSTSHTTGSVAYGMSIVYPEASTMTKENFVFNGWSIENATMPDDILTITAQWTPAVASVTAGGTTYYATLDDAIDAANSASNAVVTMLQGVTVTSQIELKAAMTIDLNGKTITSTVNTATTGTFYINASGTITIRDNGTGGKIYQEVSCSGYLYGIHLTKGSLAIESGTVHIKNTANNRAYAIYTDGSAAGVTVSGSAIVKAESSASPFGIYSSKSGCTLTMNGGTFIANGAGSRGIYMKGTTNLTNATITVTGSSKAYAIFAVSGNMTINSGTYTTSGASNNLCIFHRSNTVTIKGGYFSTSNKLYALDDGYSGTITLQGGYYNNDTELEEKCADNYHVLPLDDATYQYKVAEAYTLTWNLNGGSVQTAGTTAGLVEYGTDLTAPTVTKTGYTFKEWSPAVDQTMPESDATYTATWTAKTDTKYTVKHYKQNVAGDGYDLAETDVLSGTTASEVTPARKSYQGFDAPEAQTVTILADGSRVVTYNYTRKSYNLSWVTDGDALTGDYTNGSTKFGAAITAPNTPTKTGYTFAGWSPAKAETMPAAATEYTATWTINQYTLTVLSADETMGTVTGGGLYDYNTAHTITASPKPGFKFVEWNDHITSASREVTVTADVTYTATFDYDIASYTVKHWQQNINDDDYTEVTGDRQVLEGTIGTSTAAEAKSYTGFTAQDFSQQTIVLENTVVNIYYDRKTYTIIWDVKLSGEQEAYREDVLRYGATPSYGPDPTKESTTCCVYTFSGWQQPIVTVTANATYTGSFHVAAHPYTITFVNDNGEVLQSSEVGYASMPSYTGSEPVSSHTNSGDGYTYDFIGWKPAVAEVEGDATYTAIYSRYIGSITVTEPETITDNTTTVTTVVEDGGALTVGTEGDEVILESTTIIVEAGGDLNVEADGTIAADVFIIQATTEEQGDEDAREEVQISGELSESGSKNLTAIYYDLTRKHGTENFLARVWYAVAVPWAVEVPTYSNGGVYIKRGDEYIQQRLGATFDILSYDGACRAQNGAGANCWVYLENEIAAGADPVMVPGKLYMIFLTEETSTIRFKKKAGESIHTNSLTVTPHEAANGNDANWNGIANPATYRAYLNVESSGLVQKFVPGTQPRQGGSYLPLDLSDKQAVGQPLFIQVNPDADKVLATSTNPSAAPRRVQEENEQQARYAIGIAANGRLADRLYIQTAEEKEEGFEVGKDMSKMSVSTYVAQMWVNRYDSKLCLNTVPWKRNKADFPLGIYAPQAGEYKIFAPADIASGDNLYLTVDGRAIWNLTYAPYYVSLEKGTTTRYGLRLVRSNTPAVSTGVENTQAEAYPTAQKYLIDDVVYILREGEVYTITGQKAK